MFIIEIIQQVILPVVLLIGVGNILHRTFHFELKTFSKLLLYCYIPALTFVKIYEAKATVWLLLSIFGVLIIQFILLNLFAVAINKLLKHNKKLSSSFSNSIVLANNGNIGIPVNDLAFRHDPFAMSIQIIFVLFEIFITFTFGLINASAASIGLKKTTLQFLKMPVFYCLLLGLAFNLLHVKIPDFIWIPMNTVANGMLALALVSIGAQIASIRIYHNTSAGLLSSAVRLVISPAMAFLLINALGLQGTVAQALWIASAMPSSRNSAVLALEYDNEPEFAAQTVLISTLFSSITLTIVIYMAAALFS